MTENPTNPVPIDVAPDDGRDAGNWQPLPVPTEPEPATVDTGATRSFGYSGGHASWQAAKAARAASQGRDGGTLHVITAAARTPAVGLVASYEGSDPPGTGGIAPVVGVGSLLADGMAIRVVSRLDKHEVHHPSGDDEVAALMLRYVPAAAVTNPRCSLGVVLPDDWNSMTGAVAGYSANGLEWEVQALETLGLRIRHRLYVHASPSTMAVHFGNLAERCDLRPIARDILRAGGMVQVEAGAMTALDAVAAAGIPPWAGWVNRFDMTIVVSCALALDTTIIAQLASDAVRAAGGPATAQFGTTLGVALVDAHKLVPGVAGWTVEQFNDPRENDRAKVNAANELEVLYNAVQDACDGEVDVELIGTGPDTVIDLR